MRHCVAIVAPLMGEFTEGRRLEFPFRLALKSTGEELTLKTIYELAACSYAIDSFRNHRLPVDTGPIPAAAYYLSALLRANNYDTIIAKDLSTSTTARITASNPIAVCLSTTMIIDRRILALYVEHLHAAMPGVRIIVGGPLIWKSYRWLQLIAADPSIASNEFVSVTESDHFLFVGHQVPLAVDAYVVSAHGAPILLQLLQRIEAGSTSFEDIPNLALYAGNGSVYFTRRVAEDIDRNSDFTRWDLLDNLPRSIPLTSSYGCPYRCGFCDFCTLHPDLSLRTEQSLAAELRLLKGLIPSNPQVRSIEFTDDNVFRSPRRVAEICETLIASKVDLPWNGFLRAGSITRDNIDIIKRSRLLFAMVGVESGDLGQLRRMMKGTTPLQLRTGIELLDSVGSAVKMFFVVGYPGETQTTLRNTSEFLNNIDTRLAQYSVLPFKLSPISPVAMPQNRRRFSLYGIGDNWRHETMNSDHVEDACKTLCEQVSDVPYNYRTENIPFNLQFTDDRLATLARLRNHMTVDVLNGHTWDRVAETFACMAETMGLGKKYPSQTVKSEVSCHASATAACRKGESL